jgi:hypothetical protein
MDLRTEQKEFASSLRIDETTGTASPDFEGQYTNVRGGSRATIESTCTCPEVDVWLVGGSVAFGLGQRDDRTVASNLVRLAEADGIHLNVTNLAVPGWTTWQEQAGIAARLASVPTPPDLVVSIGGFNTTAAAFSRAVAGEATDDPLVLEPAELDEFVASGAGLDAGGGLEKIATTAANEHIRWIESMESTVARNGGTVIAFFHPDALATPHQFEPVAQVVPGLDPAIAGDMRQLLERTATLVAPPVTDLRNLYDDVPELVFTDWAHTNERGAVILAEAVWSQMETAVGREAFGT